MKHLSDDELREVVMCGPAKLAVHSEEPAHIHIVHDVCLECLARLLHFISLHFETRDVQKH